MAIAKVVVMVGNGFDLKAGLNTGAKDFLEHFINEPSSGPGQRVRDCINRDGIETWADYEERIGYYAAEIEASTEPLEVEREFFYAKRALDELLRNYLSLQDERIDEQFVASNCKDCMDSLSDWIGLLAPRERQNMLKRLSSRPLEFRYKLLCFNYTRTLNELAQPVLGAQLTPKQFADSTINHSLSGFRHVHGTLSDMPICGVDDSDQIHSETLSSSEMVELTTVKRFMQQMTGSEDDLLAMEDLKESSVVIVFGMSFGITDRRWWSAVYDQLSSNDNKYVVICVKGLSEMSHIPADYYQLTQSWKSRFFDAAGIDSSNLLPEVVGRVFVIPADRFLIVSQPLMV